MRIINLTEFRALPAGVVFAKYEPCFFGELCVKDDTIDCTCDFYYSELCCDFEHGGSSDFVDKLATAQQDRTHSIPVDFHGVQRDGLFERDQLFAVYEQADLDAMIEKLRSCVGA